MEDDSQFIISEFLLLMGELSVSYVDIRVSCGPAVSFLFWSSCFFWANCLFLILKFVFLVDELSVSYFEICVLVDELSVSYFEIRVSCGPAVSFLFWSSCFLWANCQFLILKFVFLVDGLSVSYFGVFVSYGRSVRFSFWSLFFSSANAINPRNFMLERGVALLCVRRIVVLKFACRFETAAVQTFNRRFTTTE